MQSAFYLLFGKFDDLLLFLCNPELEAAHGSVLKCTVTHLLESDIILSGFGSAPFYCLRLY